MKRRRSLVFFLVSDISLFFLFVSLFLFFSPSSLLAYRLPIKSTKHRLSINLALTSVMEFHQNNTADNRAAHPLNYSDLQNRLDLNIDYNDYRLGGRIDTFNFFYDEKYHYKCYKDFNCRAQYLPEKLFFKFNSRLLSFEAGDFYITVGRGIALSIRKVDEFGQDTTLRGARASFEEKGFQAVVAAGFSNTSNLDPITEVFYDDPNDFIFTMGAKQRLLDAFDFGVHYVYADLSKQVSSLYLLSHSHIAGLTFDWKRLLNRFDLYIEGDIQERTESKIHSTGYALYLNINAYFYPLTIQLEGQWYDNFLLNADLTAKHAIVTAPPLSYTNAPSMERQDLDTQGNNSNSKGFRLKVDYSLSPMLIFYANYLFRFGFNSPDNDKQIFIHHFYAGGDLHFTDDIHLKVSAGWRDISGLEIWKILHADLELNITIAAKQAIEVVGKYWHNEKKEDIPGTPSHNFHYLDTQLGYSFAKFLNLAFLFSFSDETQRDGLFFAGEATFHLFDYGHLKFTYGRLRGGLRCLSGVCRVFPDFEGFRAELTFKL